MEILIEKSEKELMHLTDVSLSKISFQVQSKIILYIIRPIALYASEPRTITKANEQKV